jgi:hypothetical protein
MLLVVYVLKTFLFKPFFATLLERLILQIFDSQTLQNRRFFVFSLLVFASF